MGSRCVAPEEPRHGLIAWVTTPSAKHAKARTAAARARVALDRLAQGRALARPFRVEKPRRARVAHDGFTRAGGSCRGLGQSAGRVRRSVPDDTSTGPTRAGLFSDDIRTVAYGRGGVFGLIENKREFYSAGR